MIANESTQARWGQWWRMAALLARQERAMNELRKRVDRLDARVDRLADRVDAVEQQARDELAMTDAALEKMRSDFDYALSKTKRVSDMYRIGWWHDLAPGGRSRPTIEYFGAGDFDKLLDRLTELRTGGNHVRVEIAGLGSWKRVAL